MTTAFTKRTTFIVADAVSASRFYRDVFGWTVWYDNAVTVAEGFPPCAPDGQPSRLIMLQAHDPKIGMVGFLAYEDFDPEPTPGFADRPKLRLGDAVLVLEAEHLDATYARAVAAGARIVNPPTRWTVPAPNGTDTIDLYSMSMFDPQGIYSEIGQSRG